MPEEKDRCVGSRNGKRCNRETVYEKNTHIDFRLHYVEGAGQLCAECNVDIYGPCGCQECAAVVATRRAEKLVAH